jgi:hypothetical protein
MQVKIGFRISVLSGGLFVLVLLMGPRIELSGGIDSIEMPLPADMSVLDEVREIMADFITSLPQLKSAPFHRADAPCPEIFPLVDVSWSGFSPITGAPPPNNAITFDSLHFGGRRENWLRSSSHAIESLDGSAVEVITEAYCENKIAIQSVLHVGRPRGVAPGMSVGEKETTEQCQDKRNGVPIDDVCIGEHQPAGGDDRPTASKQFPVSTENEHPVDYPLRNHGNNGIQNNEQKP